MTTYQRPGSPFWYYDLPDPNAPGGRRRKSTKVAIGNNPKASRRAAEGVAQTERGAVLARRDPNARFDICLADALQFHIDALRADGKPFWEGYVRSRDKMLGLIPSAAGRFRLDGTRLVSSIGPADVRDLKNARAREGNKPGTIAHELRLLRAACNRARAEGAKGATVEKWSVPAAPMRLRYLSTEEAAALLDYLDPDRPVPSGSKGKLVVPGGKIREARQDAHDLALFFLCTGARSDEANGLTRSSVNLKAGTATLRGKGGKTREVPLAGVCAAMLTRRLSTPGHALVFPGRGGGTGSRKRVGPARAIGRAMNAIGLNPPETVKTLGSCSVHTLRHTFASWLRQGGTGLDELQDLLGHSSLQMTVRYAKVAPTEVNARVVAALDKVLCQ